MIINDRSLDHRLSSIKHRFRSIIINDRSIDHRLSSIKHRFRSMIINDRSIDRRLSSIKHRFRSMIIKDRSLDRRLSSIKHRFRSMIINRLDCSTPLRPLWEKGLGFDLSSAEGDEGLKISLFALADLFEQQVHSSLVAEFRQQIHTLLSLATHPGNHHSVE